MTAKHTDTPWSTVGAALIWKTGENGGAVAIIAEPECKDSGDFKRVEVSSKRWDEAMANADLILRAVNSHADLLAALEAQEEAERADSDHLSHLGGMGVAKTLKAAEAEMARESELGRIAREAREKAAALRTAAIAKAKGLPQ